MNETPKIGRPILPKKEKRSQHIAVRFTVDELKEVKAAAAELKERPTTWARKKLLAAARRV